MGLYAGVDNNLTLCPLQSLLQHLYHGQPYAVGDFVPQSGTLDLASVGSSSSNSDASIPIYLPNDQLLTGLFHDF